jgi:hypothetical protein
MNNCSSQTNIGIHESFPTFWSQTGCGGTSMTLESGVYNTLSNQKLRGNDIIGLWVPANYTIWAYTGENLTGSSAKYEGGSVYSDLNNPNIGVGSGQIRSLKITQEKGWNDFRESCCRADSLNYTSADCGLLWGPTNISGECDTVVQNYCNIHPWDTYCSCLQSNAKNVAPCVDNKCAAGAYTTSTMKDILNNGCPTNIVCNQQVILGNNVSDNVIKTNMYQICGDNTTNSAGKANGQTLVPSSSGTGSGTLIDVNKGVIGQQTTDNKPIASSILPLNTDQQVYLQKTLGDNYELIIICSILILIAILVTSMGDTGNEKQKRISYPSYPNYYPNYYAQ